MELNRVERLALISQYPVLLDNIRVCWMDSAAYNCGQCEKCLRTMVALEGLGALQHCRAFPAKSADPTLVRRVCIDEHTAPLWKELMDLPLRPELERAVAFVLHNQKYDLPPYGIRRVGYRALRAWESIAS